ncbi:hypothetical protein Phum_PHUM350490 [Pediculus humanus corporis]|uniref:Uncharacterized protein n=1 Tax=Pediculus humanus subsp. corporis TaxID=121224 RepID=E0VP22_PEDHC|nr:uncharacterized protein Phum_PHUM350490 [Pediculus humanus corporis]EEB15128.1 hypothetical protein Phum_PHUM350490 [Pediculus humanus corporis]
MNYNEIKNKLIATVKEMILANPDIIEHTLKNSTQLKSECQSTEGVINELKEYTKAEHNYVDSKLKIVPLLKEIINMKEKYSEKFQDKCTCQNINSEIMFKKLEFLKLQFFYKLYEENNALQGHLILQNMLIKELDSLKKNYNDIIARNNQFDCIKNDSNYLNLFKQYKELKEIEKRAEIMKSI